MWWRAAQSAWSSEYPCEPVAERAWYLVPRPLGIAPDGPPLRDPLQRRGTGHEFPLHLVAPNRRSKMGVPGTNFRAATSGPAVAGSGVVGGRRVSRRDVVSGGWTRALGRPGWPSIAG